MEGAVEALRRDHDVEPSIATAAECPAVPEGTTGDVYLHAFDDVVEPVIRRFDPTWLLVSAGFDAHERDPITGLGLTSGDFADLTARLVALVPAGRLVAFLEGGYDLQALADSTAAALGAMVGLDVRPERPTIDP